VQVSNTLFDCDSINSICRKKKDANPALNVLYQYAKSSSNTTLCGHLDKFHRVKWLHLANERGWTSKLWSQDQSMGTDDGTTSQDRSLDKFSKATFHQYLLNFIVMNNQVPS
jgi:hypothetical protein